jgi:hypothetical protein
VTVLRGTLKVAKLRGELPGDIAAIMPDQFSAEYKPRSTADVLAHEVGHALCRSFTQTGDCHAETGLMASPSYESEIDGATLSAVCALAPCSAFVPEGGGL